MVSPHPRGPVLAFAVVLAAVVTASCGPVKKQQAKIAARPECPHDWTDTTESPWTFAHPLGLAGAATDIPEYNDCQKFLVDNGAGGLKFDKLEAIFVRGNVQAAYEMKASPNDTKPMGTGTSVAVTTPPSPPQNLLTGLPVAIVYSEGDYAPLGIKQGFDCLVLKNKLPAGLDAWMVPVATEDLCTTTQMPSTVGGYHLDVALIAAHNNHGVSDPIPGVARWDFDTVSNLYYIGIACPQSWCEIHKPGSYASSARYDSSVPNGHVFRMKGWYDEQYLARYEPNGTVVKDGVRGTLFPVPDLQGRTMSAYKENGRPWVNVAWVSLDHPSAKYHDYFGFEEAHPQATASGNTPRNEVALCFSNGDPNRCGPLVPKTCTLDTGNNGVWYARVTSVSRAEKFFCVMYRPLAGGVQPPGVARWRWKIKDESIWVSCPSGCCEVDAEM